MENKKFEEINLVDAFDYGSFKLQKLFLLKFNRIYNTCSFKFNKITIDLENIDYDKLKAAYPNAIFKIHTIHSEQSNSAIDEVQDDDEEGFYIGGLWQSASLTVFDEDAFYVLDSTGMLIYYLDQDPVELYKKFISLCPTITIKPKETEIKLVAFNNDYYTIKSKIKETTIDIDKNYNDDFKPVFNDIQNFLNDRNSGLIILRGEKGTGKTSLIRHLITNFPNNYIIVTNAVADRLASPEFISFMLDHKDSIFILEDCEQILMKRSEGFGANGAIATILNMSDGLMSDIFNVKFICTFNADIDQIDEALLRKGRCFANYEFKRLCKEKTEVLLKEQGIDVPEDEIEPMTLANIYNYNSADCSEEIDNNESKIGF